MITVKDRHGRTDKITVGKTFEVDGTGCLLIKEDIDYRTVTVRAYSAGNWQDVVIEIAKKEPAPACQVDLDKIHEALPTGVPVMLTGPEYFDTCFSGNSVFSRQIEVRAVGNDTTYFYKGREIKQVEARLFEKEIVARCLALASV